MAVSMFVTFTAPSLLIDQAPGAPGVGAVLQVSNSIYRMTVTPPIADADGSPLTDLKRLTIGTAQTNGGLNPFDGLGTEAEVVATGATMLRFPLTGADAGVTRNVDVPVLNAGGPDQAFVVWVDDDALLSSQPSPCGRFGVRG